MKKIDPKFWKRQNPDSSQGHTSFDFARKWKFIVLFTSFMALLPLFVMALVDFSLTRRIIEDEVKSSMVKILKSAVVSVSFSDEREKSVLEYMAHLDTGEDNDIFVVNKDGTLVTASFYYGKPGIGLAFNSTRLNDKTGIEKDVTPHGTRVIAGYAKIPESSLVFILAKSEKMLTDLWFKPRLKLVGYLAISIILILLSIMGMATFLVGRIHLAEQKRSKALHHAEHANKLASIGRLASGVAHEINNPLAIINQKTGLILDLFDLRKDVSSDGRMIDLAKDVLDSVKRCGAITRRLLDFSRDMEHSIQPVDIGEVIGQMLAFLEKEAERRKITISVDNRDTIPCFECDRGSLQQIFFNLFDNAFTAMEDGGRLRVCVRYKKKDTVTITVSDNGKGIAEHDLDKIFEPFYSSKKDHWGTGLGLSITYGLVKEIGGDVMVKSRINKGTEFTLILPLKPPGKKQRQPTKPLKEDLMNSKQQKN